MKRSILQTLLIGVLGLLTLFSLLVTVLAVIPVNTKVEIREQIKVSTSRLNAASEANGLYIVEFSGALRNTTDQEIVVERLVVPAKASGKGEPILFEVTNIEIPPKSTVTVSSSIGATEYYERVGEITATVGGEETYLRNPAELELIRELSKLPEEIRLAAEARDPSRLNRYAASVATAFHHFYTVCRIKEAATPELRDAHIKLVHCVAQVIRNALSCLGVSAPDHM